MQKYALPIAILFTAVVLAIISAFVSVTGMGKIFSGWPILLMMSAIELGKLVTVSVLYRLWNELKWLRYLLIPMTVVIMLLTSAGVYGYLGSSYENTASGMRTQSSMVVLEDKKKESLNEQIKSYEGSIERKEGRSSTLSGLRAQQENRMDSLYAKNQIRTAKSVQASIAQTDVEINRLSRDADSLNTLIGQARMDIARIDSVIVSMDSKGSQGEVKALKYMSRLTGWSMDSVANVFMLLIIFVFDPMAIILIIAFNIAMDKANKNDDEEDLEYDYEPDEDELMEDGSIEGASEQPSIEEEPSNHIEQEVSPEPEQHIETPVSVEEKADPTVVYETNEVGDFVKAEPSPEPTTNGQEIQDDTENKQGLYLSLLQILYQDGKLNEHDHIDAYDRFAASVEHAGINCSKYQIEEFLKKCVLLRIIKIGEEHRIALKSYDNAVQTMKSSIS